MNPLRSLFCRILGHRWGEWWDYTHDEWHRVDDQSRDHIHETGQRASCMMCDLLVYRHVQYTHVSRITTTDGYSQIWFTIEGDE